MIMIIIPSTYDAIALTQWVSWFMLMHQVSLPFSVEYSVNITWEKRNWILAIKLRGLKIIATN